MHRFQHFNSHLKIIATKPPGFAAALDLVRDQPGLPAAEAKFWMYNTAFSSISSNRNRGSFDSEELGGKQRRENWEAQLFTVSWPPYCFTRWVSFIYLFIYFILYHAVNFQFKCQPSMKTARLLTTKGCRSCRVWFWRLFLSLALSYL